MTGLSKGGAGGKFSSKREPLQQSDTLFDRFYIRRIWRSVRFVRVEDLDTGRNTSVIRNRPGAAATVAVEPVNKESKKMDVASDGQIEGGIDSQSQSCLGSPGFLPRLGEVGIGLGPVVWQGTVDTSVTSGKRNGVSAQDSLKKAPFVIVGFVVGHGTSQDKLTGG